MPPAWRGSSTSGASTSTRIRCAPKTSTTPTSCASTSTRCPGVDWSQIVDVAMVAREVLDDVGLVGWPKTSGSRGLHILVRIAPQWDFKQVRLAAETLAREVENRAPGLATARWWKEERGESVFVDFNQNAKDRTVASAYSIRPLADARVSTPMDWDEVRTRRPEEFTVPTVLERFADDRRPARRASTTPSARSTACCDSPTSSAPPRSRRAAAARATGVASRRCRSSRSPAPRPSPRRSRLSRCGGRGIRPSSAQLHPADVLVDGMRGSSSLWYRVRVNLQHVPEARATAAGGAHRRLRPVGRQAVAGAPRRRPE